MIGGQDSGTTEETKEILLEAAVYKYANVRRTGRRLGLRTEAGTRHEKILDPNNVEVALERAYALLFELANAKPLGEKTDFYPKKMPPAKIILGKEKIKQLSGLDLPPSVPEKILSNLGCLVEKNKSGDLIVAPPTLRTDLKDPADLVEEVIRVYGYENIPVASLGANANLKAELTEVGFKEELKDALVNLGLNETITLSLRENTELPLFEAGGQFPKIIKIINPPDPDIASLRPSLIPGLVLSAKKADAFKQQNQSFFEIGKVFYANKKGGYFEEDRVGIIKRLPEVNQLSYSRASSIIRQVLALGGVDHVLTKTSDIPSFDNDSVAEITTSGKKVIGYMGLLNGEVKDKLKLTSDFFIAELSVAALFGNKGGKNASAFLYPTYPSLYEDLTVLVTKDSELGAFLEEAASLSPLIKDVRLTGIYQNSRTIRITYQDPEKSVSNEVVKPIREAVEKLATTKYKLQLR